MPRWQPNGGHSGGSDGMSRAHHHHTMALGLGFAFGASRGRPSTVMASFSRRRRRRPIPDVDRGRRDGFRSRRRDLNMRVVPGGALSGNIWGHLGVIWARGGGSWWPLRALQVANGGCGKVWDVGRRAPAGVARWFQVKGELTERFVVDQTGISTCGRCCRYRCVMACHVVANARQLALG